MHTHCKLKLTENKPNAVTEHKYVFICFNYALQTETNYTIDNNFVSVTQLNYSATMKHLQFTIPREEYSTPSSYLPMGVLTL